MNKILYNVLFAALILCWSNRLNAQIITTMAGTGTPGYSGDKDIAAYAQISEPSALAVDKLGNVFICEKANNRIRKIDIYGVITTIAGNGVQGMSGDGGPATNAKLFAPSGLRLDDTGNIFISDGGNNRIRKIDTNGIITSIIGNGVAGFGGDGGPAISAKLEKPGGIALDKHGNIYIADTRNNRIRKVSNADWTISTIAGKNDTINAYAGDGGPATNALLDQPTCVAVDKDDNVYIGDGFNYRVRKIDAATGIIHTVAGNSKPAYGGDHGAPYTSQINIPTDLVFDSKGNLYIADRTNFRIRKLDTAGIISTVAGTGIFGYSGDGGPADEAQLYFPTSIAVDTADNLYIGEGTGRLRFVFANNTAGDSINIFPNPCSHDAELFLYSKYEELADIEVISLEGRIMHHSVAPTNRFIWLNFDAPGMYMVYAVTKHNRWKTKLMNLPGSAK